MAASSRCAHTAVDPEPDLVGQPGLPSRLLPAAAAAAAAAAASWSAAVAAVGAAVGDGGGCGGGAADDDVGWHRSFCSDGLSPFALISAALRVLLVLLLTMLLLLA